jgi:CBS domain-containing protein
MLEQAAFVVGDLMTRDVVVVHPDLALRDAVRAMTKRGISGIPVVDSSGLVLGMLTEGDLLRWHEGYTERQEHWLEMLSEGLELAPEFLKGILEQNSKVHTVMSKGVITVTEDMPAREVAHLMYTKNIKRVPVVRDGKLVGILSRSDLIRALSQRLDEMTGELAEGQRVNLNEALRRAREERVATRARQQ